MSCCAWRLVALVLFYVLYLVMGALVFARIEAPLGNIVSAFIQGSHRNNLNLRMEFLDILLTKDSSLLLHAIHSPSCWRILQKTIFISGFKIHYKKIHERKKSSGHK
jgi:hypothetical protein